MRPRADITVDPAAARTRSASAARVRLLLIIGPPGVGKSSAAKHLSRLLEEARVAHAYVDRDDFGRDGLLCEDPLIDLNELLHARVVGGAQRLIVAWRVESGEELARVRAVLDWADVTVCRLRAEPRELLARIAAAEPSFQSLHLQTMAMQIAPRLEHQAREDILLATDSTPPRAVAMRAFRQWAMQSEPPAGDSP